MQDRERLGNCLQIGEQGDPTTKQGILDQKVGVTKKKNIIVLWLYKMLTLGEAR